MLRLIHAHTVQGPLRIDDIDDGLPNKTAHRMGSTADPKAYVADGYANKPKQPCNIPYAKPSNSALPGYIDLFETERVKLSASQGKINGMRRAGLLTVVSFVEGDNVTPTITAAEIDSGTSNLILTGTGFLSITPNYTVVNVLGANPVQLTQTQITAAGGTISNVSIVIPAALVPLVSEANTVKVTSDDHASAIHVIGAEPAITLAELNRPGVGDITITGTNFASNAPLTSSVAVTGVGAVTLTRAAILAAGGVAAFTDVNIVIPAALVPGVAENTSLVSVTAEGFPSATAKLKIRPVVTESELDAPGIGDLTLTGTNFLSSVVGDSSVAITGVGAVTLTRAAILAAGGVAAFTDTSIVIPAALVPAVAEATSSANVIAEGLTGTTPVVLKIRPVVTVADLDNPGAGDLTITGTNLLSTVVGDSSVVITGTGAVTLTRAAILAAGGVAAFTDGSIVIPAALVPAVALVTSSAAVIAEGMTSAPAVALS